MRFKNITTHFIALTEQVNQIGFKDENGHSIINDAHKIRITLSNKAYAIIKEDMDLFEVPTPTEFINTVFDNFKKESKASLVLYLQQRKIELDRLFTIAKLDEESKRRAIEQILSQEQESTQNELFKYKQLTGKSKLYHINKDNIKYLEEYCEEGRLYDSPGLYIRFIIEEYCTLPFIEREKIYRKNIYELVEQACQERKILKITQRIRAKEQILYVYPYKILPDPFHTQSYLVCFSRELEKEDSAKIISSFSMARLNKISMLSKKFHLSKDEYSDLDEKIFNNSPAYMLGTPEHITVKLNKVGKKIYKTKLFSRPERIDTIQNDDIYVFNCTQKQAFNYFFSFGSNVEIISPSELREEFIKKYSEALEQYK